MYTRVHKGVERREKRNRREGEEKKEAAKEKQRHGSAREEGWGGAGGRELADTGEKAEETTKLRVALTKGKGLTFRPLTARPPSLAFLSLVAETIPTTGKTKK